MDLSRIKDRIISVRRDKGGKVYILYIQVREDLLEKILDKMSEEDSIEALIEKLIDKGGFDADKLEEVVSRVLERVLGSKEVARESAREITRRVEETIPDLGELQVVGEAGEKEEKAAPRMSLEDAIAQAIVVVMDEGVDKKSEEE